MRNGTRQNFPIRKTAVVLDEGLIKQTEQASRFSCTEIYNAFSPLETPPEELALCRIPPRTGAGPLCTML